jgi:hypothetical protein
MKVSVWQPYYLDGTPKLEWHSPRTPGRAYGLWLWSIRLPFGRQLTIMGGKRRNAK